MTNSPNDRGYRRYLGKGYRPWHPYAGCAALIFIIGLVILFIALLPPPW